MARVPVYNPGGTVRSEAGGGGFVQVGGVSSAAFGGQQAEALGQGANNMARAGEALAKRAAEARDAERENELVRHKVQAIKGLSDLQLEAQKDADFTTMGERYAARVEELRGSIAGNIADARVGQAFDNAFAQLATTASGNISGIAWKKDVDFNQAELNQSLADLSHLYSGAGDEVAKQQVRDTAIAAVRAKTRAGYLSLEDGDKLARGWSGKAEEADLRAMMTSDPEAAVKAIGDGRFANINEVALSRLQDMAFRRSEAVRADRDATTVANSVLGRLSAAPAADLAGAVAMVESNGQDYTPQGAVLASAKGAKGAMQVMDGTAEAPGFGVRPAQDGSLDERNRVGRDYLGAMLTRYDGNRAIALAAYNAGPGAVDGWLKDNGDPRSGQVSESDWIAKIPYKETRAYVPAVLGRLDKASGGSPTWTAENEAAALDAVRASNLEGAGPARAEAKIRSAFSLNRRVESQQAHDAEISRQAQLSDMKIAVGRSQATYDDIEAAYAGGKGWLKPSERTELTRELDQAGKSQQALQEATITLTRRLAGDPSAIVDFKAPKMREAADQVYSEMMGRMKGRPNEEVYAAALDFSKATGVIPPSVMGNIRGEIRAGTPEQQIGAADLIGRYESVNPDLLHDFANEDIRRAMLLREFAGRGVAAEQAVQKADDMLRMPKTQQDAMRTQYDAVVKQKPTEKWLKDKLQGGPLDRGWANTFGEAYPDIPPVYTAQFDAAVREEFTMNGGNLEAARQTANIQMDRKWGVSFLTTPNGAAVMAHLAPERLFAVGSAPPSQQSAWMREQLRADITAMGGMTDPEKAIEDRVYLVPAPGVTETGGRPKYLIMALYANGMLEPMRQGSDLVYWHPNWDSSPAAQRMAESISKGMDRVRAQREAISASAGAYRADIDAAFIEAANSQTLPGLR
jgi:hypothetical protein